MLAAPSLLAQGSAFAIRNGDYMGELSVSADPDIQRPPSIKGCDRSRQSIGYITGSGIISYVIGADGHVDTAAIQVVSHEGVTAATLSSLVRRVLVTCSFRPAKSVAGNAPALVQQQVSFHSGGRDVHELEAGRVYPEFAQGTPTGGTAEDSVEVDELPALRTCQLPSYHGHGDVMYKFTIGTDGRIEPQSLVVVHASSNDPDLLRVTRTALLSCLYAPGRVDGVPIRYPAGQGVSYH